MPINASSVAELREATGAGMMDAKRALEEAGGDVAKATEILKEKGLAKAAKKADRETKEGLVRAYIHSNGKVGALVQVLCETDFVARTEAFQAFCHDIALHVCAMEPRFIKREDIPADVVEAQKAQFAQAGGNVEEQLNQWYSEVVLLEQRFVKDGEKTIDTVLKGTIASLGENIQIAQITRFKI